MTVVNPKSISGITSITTASGSDNLLTIHTSDASNTERFRIDSTGTTKIVTGIVTTLTATTGIVTTFEATTGDITTLRTPTGIATHFTADKISLPDSSDGSLCIGIGSDFKINHNGTDSFITEVGGGDLYIQGSDIIMRDAGTLDKHIEMTQNGAVDIYHDNSKKFETTSAGVSVTGSATVSGDVSIADKIIHTGDTNTALRFPDADTITAETGGTERYRITSDGKFVGGPLANGHSTARCATGGLDLRAGQGGAGFPSLKIGADSGTTNATTLSSNTRKQARIGCASYHNSYDFATFLYFDSDTSTNELNIGGGTGHGYAATNISLWTAANNTTTTGTERIRIHSGGTVNIPSGITLGETVSSTAASNTLDDYEEGTFTPDWRGASALGTTTYGSYNSASYIKVGNQVTVRGYSELNGTSGGSGMWFIHNLPFTVKNGHGYRSVGSVLIENFNLDSDIIDVVCFANPNNNHMHLRGNRDNANYSSNIRANTDDNFEVAWTLTYQVA